MFPEGDPIGRRVEIRVRPGDVELIVVGVAGDIRPFLFAETQPTDGPTYAIVTLFLSAVLLAAAAIPALRATRLNPIHALRHE